MINIDLNVNRNVQFLSGGWRESQEPNFQTVLHDVFVLRPNNLGELLKFINLKKRILCPFYIFFIIYLFSKTLESLILFSRFGIKVL